MPAPFKVYSLNEIGGRKNNEDAIWPAAAETMSNNNLFIVCDGVGGNSHGEVASAYASQFIGEYIKKNLLSEDHLTNDFLEKAREYAMERFCDYISQHPEAERMSTTLTLAYIKQNSIFVAWCGDSKVMLLRNGEIVFQSEDHSLVNELVKCGELTPEEALTHPQRNVITRSLQATAPYAIIDTVELTDVQEGDYLLLCTDGVTENITPGKLKFILSEGEGDDILEQFQQYCFGKTKDNYSMQLIKLTLANKVNGGNSDKKIESGIKAFFKKLVS
jgi:PPM family protein phosphatase